MAEPVNNLVVISPAHPHVEVLVFLRVAGQDWLIAGNPDSELPTVATYLRLAPLLKTLLAA